MYDIKAFTERKRDGKNGWYKGRCCYSPTGWAWHREGGCMCQPCKPPKVDNLKSEGKNV